MRRLSTQIFAFQLLSLTLGLAVAAATYVIQERRALDHQYEQFALGIARTVAGDRRIEVAVSILDTSGYLQQRAEQIRKDTGALFVVITDSKGVRYSHPNPALVGKRIPDDAAAVLAGHEVTTVENGSLGRSARGKVPLRDPDNGRVIGAISVGVAETTIGHKLVKELPGVAITMLVVGAGGLALSLGFAARLKRRTLGLELDEITALMQEREALLYGIKEGVVGIDASGSIVLVNSAGQALLDAGPGIVGQPYAKVLPPDLSELVTRRERFTDAAVVVNSNVLIANWSPVFVSGQDQGSVITLRDRTELEGLSGELDRSRELTFALRAQAHEYTNRLHAIAGMIQLGRYDDSVAFIMELNSAQTVLGPTATQRIANPELVGLLLAKAAIASEKGVTVRITDDSSLRDPALGGLDMQTVIGNLIDNAVEAAAAEIASGRVRESEVEVAIRQDAASLHIAVTDSGPGVADDMIANVFARGFTTKGSPGQRGIGLALVAEIVARRAGTVRVSSRPGGGSCFAVDLPVPEGPTAGSGSAGPESARERGVS